MPRGALIIAAVLAGLVTLACSSGGSDSGPSVSKDDDGSTRTASVEGIDVKATWLGSDGEPREGLAEYPPGRFLLLEVSLDTHSGDLGSIDMVEAAALRTDAGLLEPEAWVASSDESHHRGGVLVFPREALTGSVTLTLALGEEKVELFWEHIPGN